MLEMLTRVLQLFKWKTKANQVLTMKKERKKKKASRVVAMKSRIPVTMSLVYPEVDHQKMEMEVGYHQ